jgi:hypothetical protein
MRAVLFVHLVLVAVWLGCILVEAIYEHAIEKTDDMRRFVSRLHWTTDKFVEIPAFLGVLATGGYRLSHTAMTPLLWVKVAFGLVAILFNAICVVIVVRRLGYARKGDFVAWEAIDHKQHVYGAVVLIALLAALGIGGYAFVSAV